jgi:hypothetical protein
MALDADENPSITDFAEVFLIAAPMRPLLAYECPNFTALNVLHRNVPQLGVEQCITAFNSEFYAL